MVIWQLEQNMCAMNHVVLLFSLVGGNNSKFRLYYNLRDWCSATSSLNLSDKRNLITSFSDFVFQSQTEPHFIFSCTKKSLENTFRKYRKQCQSRFARKLLWKGLSTLTPERTCFIMGNTYKHKSQSEHIGTKNGGVWKIHMMITMVMYVGVVCAMMMKKGSYPHFRGFISFSLKRIKFRYVWYSGQKPMMDVFKKNVSHFVQKTQNISDSFVNFIH